MRPRARKKAAAAQAELTAAAFAEEMMKVSHAFGVPGASPRSPQSFEETWRILDQLTPEIAVKIGGENAATGV